MKKALSFLLSLLLFASAFTLAPVTGETAVDDPLVPVIIGTQVHVNFDITVKFYLSVPEGTTSAGLYISEGGRTAARVKGELQEDGTYLVSYTHVTVDEMTVVISATPFGVVGTEYVKGKQSYDFTLQDYAMRLLFRDDLSKEDRDVLLAMLNYGAAVQDYLDFRLYNKPDSYLTESEREFPSLPPVDSTENDLTLDGPNDLENYQTTADCTTITMAQTGYLRFWFFVDIEGQGNLRVNGGAGVEGYKNVSPEAEAAAFCRGYRVQVTCDGITKEYELEKYEDGLGYVAATGGISFFDLRREMSFRVIDPEGAVSQTYYCSVERFLRQSLENGTLTPEMQALLQRALVFGDALTLYRNAK
jgi:hypothetical protein